MDATRALSDTEALATLIDSLLASSDSTHGLRRALRHARRELLLFESLRTAKTTPTQLADTSRIQIGGGSRLLESFVNIDIVEPADVLWDVRESLPLPDGESQLIFMEHFLEHIDYPTSVHAVLSECFRALCSGGKLIIGVPDARHVISGYVSSDATMLERMEEAWYGRRGSDFELRTYIDLVNYVFRDQDDSDRYTPHLWAYDDAKLRSLCLDAGFRKVEPWHHDPEIANPARAWGSVYVVAVK